jgi:hypothetical protein
MPRPIRHTACGDHHIVGSLTPLGFLLVDTKTGGRLLLRPSGQPAGEQYRAIRRVLSIPERWKRQVDQFLRVCIESYRYDARPTPAKRRRGQPEPAPWSELFRFLLGIELVQEVGRQQRLRSDRIAARVLADYIVQSPSLLDAPRSFGPDLGIPMTREIKDEMRMQSFAERLRQAGRTPQRRRRRLRQDSAQ